jgi:hypothetical protein
VISLVKFSTSQFNEVNTFMNSQSTFYKNLKISRDSLECLQYIQQVMRKVCLISESFSIWRNSPKKNAKSQSLALSTNDMILRIVIWHLFFVKFSQSEKNSEIKPLLKNYRKVRLLKGLDPIVMLNGKVLI